MNIVLQKYISKAGICSRRKAENLIVTGKIKINDVVAKLGDRVQEEDIIKINNKKINLQKEKIYIKLNKPVGYTCTNRKFKNEKNIFDLVNVKEKLFAVGRLDKNSHGLTLLTNDGDLTQILTHPKFEHEKKYLIEVFDKKFNENEIAKELKKGIKIKNEKLIAKNAKYLGNNKFEIILTEGKKRQLRQMFGALNLNVKDLKRVEISSLRLNSLKEGDWEYLSKKEIAILKKK